jgi:hypothetical protein
MASAFGVIAIVAVSVQVVILVALHALPTGYHPVRDAISDYGIGRYRGYFWAELVAGALACAFVAFALADLHPYAPTVVVALLLANTVARLLMPAFPTDQSGNRFGSAKGTVHMLLAFVAFGAVAAAATGLGGLFTHYPAWHGAKGLLVVLGWVVLTGAVATALALLGPRLKRVFGLIERLFTLSVIVWVYVISIEVVRLAK